MNSLILLATINGILAVKNANQDSLLKDDDFMKKILHDDAMFGEFMLSGAISRDRMNEMLKTNRIPLEVSAELYEILMENWVYKILGWGIHSQKIYKTIWYKIKIEWNIFCIHFSLSILWQNFFLKPTSSHLGRPTVFQSAVNRHASFLKFKRNGIKFNNEIFNRITENKSFPVNWKITLASVAKVWEKRIRWFLAQMSPFHSDWMRVHIEQMRQSAWILKIWFDIGESHIRVTNLIFNHLKYTSHIFEGLLIK